MPLEIVRNDITKMQVDAIVNAANSQLKMGGGVCGAIFTAAGAAELQAECDRIGHCPVGQAVATAAYHLPARYVIHTVGPVWQGGDHGEEVLLRGCYTNSLALAKQLGCQSIAFPLISSGIFGYPKDKALQVAIAAIGGFLMENEMAVYLVVFDKKAFTLSSQLFANVQKFIEDNYVDEEDIHARRLSNLLSNERQLLDMADATISESVEAYGELRSEKSLTDAVQHLDLSFSQALLRLIDQKGMTDVQTYRLANIDRKLFSKIRKGNGYNPSKKTALALAVALGLNLKETRDLLDKAGYSLSRSHKMDIIVEFFIRQGGCGIHEINQALYAFDQPLLGA
jgi:O-acetyl-ADP-ribose deacetylase